MPTFSLQQKHAAQDHHIAQLAIRLERETVTQPAAFTVLSLLGDQHQLRGIPAIGRGVTGAITGTRPGDIRTPWLPFPDHAEPLALSPARG